jgi:hypothetical protein
MSNLEEAQRAVKGRLRTAVRHLQARGLQKAATWNLEQITGIDSFNVSGQEKFTRVDVYEGISDDDTDKLMLARSFLDAGEYQRCAYFLQSNVVVQAQELGSSAFHLHLFILSYARYMAGEKLRDQLSVEATSSGEDDSAAGASATAGNKSPKVRAEGNGERRATTNPNLRSIYNDLLPVYKRGLMDGFALYVFAVVVRDLHRQQGVGLHDIMAEMKHSEGMDVETSQYAGRDDGSGPLSARQLFVQAIQAYPWNWCVVDVLRCKIITFY